MSFGEAALKVLKDQLLPEIGEVKLTMGAVVARLESMERESVLRFDLIDRRFEQVDRRFDQIEKRIEEQGAEHSRRMDLLDRRMECLESRMERTEATVVAHGERVAQLTEAVARLTLLGDHVRHVDEMAAELRELRRRQDEFERRVFDEVLPRLPKVGT